MEAIRSIPATHRTRGFGLAGVDRDAPYPSFVDSLRHSVSRLPPCCRQSAHLPGHPAQYTDAISCWTRFQNDRFSFTIGRVVATSQPSTGVLMDQSWIRTRTGFYVRTALTDRSHRC